jgi:predicted Zn-dependent protease
MSPRNRIGLLAIALLGAEALSAHPEIEDALIRLATQIAATPNEASLYLARGELYAKHAEWPLAEANFLRAAELSPHLPRLDIARGSLALATGHPDEACVLLTRALAVAPADPEVRILRGRALALQKMRPAALADYDVALRGIPAPSPELFLERAALFDSPEEALQSLDEGISRLGPVVSLHLRALEIEISLGRTDEALVRIDRLAATSERRELWLKRRGDLLSSAGRPAEARAAYRAALAAIARLPDWFAQSPDTARLSAELVRLGADRP